MRKTRKADFLLSYYPQISTHISTPEFTIKSTFGRLQYWNDEIEAGAWAVDPLRRGLCTSVGKWTEKLSKHSHWSSYEPQTQSENFNIQNRGEIFWWSKILDVFVKFLRKMLWFFLARSVEENFLGHTNRTTPLERLNPGGKRKLVAILKNVS